MKGEKTGNEKESWGKDISNNKCSTDDYYIINSYFTTYACIQCIS